MNCEKCGNPLKKDSKFCSVCGTPIRGATPEVESRVALLEKALGYKYKILKKIGAGGFADVYLGEHTELGRKVAIKILMRALSEEGDAIERFRRESRAAAKLSHPNIIDIYDVGESGEIYYFVMKYVEGETLATKLHREKKIQPAEAIHIIRQVSDALAYAHERNIIHRDIKPANIMLDEYGKAILMDFGIARLQLGGQLTRTGTLMGTPHYLPPEQPLGKPVDPRSDIYSLGIVFYEMLAGRVPFQDDAAIALIYKHINEAPPPLKNLAPEIPMDLCNVVHKMIEKLPENRYQSAEDLILALEDFSMIYPFRTTPSSRRSTPSGKRDTEKLLFLAREHVQQQKPEKAMEIYAAVLQRQPDHAEAKQRSSELLSGLIENTSRDIAAKQFQKAKEGITQLEYFAPKDPRLSALRADLEREEQKERKESDFKSHYDAGQVALRHDNATLAVEHLTKALTIDPSNKEAMELLRDARSAYEQNRRKAEYANAFAEAEYYYNSGSYDIAFAAIRKALDLEQNPQALELQEKIHAAQKQKTHREAEIQRVSSEVDQFCEKLEFASAQKLLSQIRDSFPDFWRSSSQIVERNRLLHEKLVRAEDLLQQNKWEESQKSYEDFLATPLPYDFQVFYGLRKRAEESLRTLRGKRIDSEVEQLLKKADVFLRMEKYEDARGECKKVLAIHPNHSAALAKLEEVDRIQHSVPSTQEIEEMITGMNPAAVQRSGPEEQRAQEIEPQVLQTDLVSATPVPQAVPVRQPPPKQAPSTPSVVAAQIPPHIRRERKIPWLVLILVSGTAFVLVVVAVLFLWTPGEPGQTMSVPVAPPNPTEPKREGAVVAPILVSIDVQPWANLEITGGSLKEKITDTTPVLLRLTPGRYTVVFSHPEFAGFTEIIEVNPERRSFRFRFKQLNPETLADSILR